MSKITKLIFLGLCLSTAPNALSLTPKAQKLSKRLQTIFRDFVKSPIGDLTDIPGIYARFDSLDIPFKVLRKTSLALLEKMSMNIFQDSSDLSSQLRHVIPGLSHILVYSKFIIYFLWENGRKDEAKMLLNSMRHYPLEDKTFKYGFDVLSHDSDSQKEPPTDELYISSDMRGLYEIFYNPLPNNITNAQLLEKLLHKEPNFIFFLDRDFDNLMYPDIVKTILQKVQAPHFELLEKGRAAQKIDQKLFVMQRFNDVKNILCQLKESDFEALEKRLISEKMDEMLSIMRLLKKMTPEQIKNLETESHFDDFLKENFKHPAAGVRIFLMQSYDILSNSWPEKSFNADRMLKTQKRDLTLSLALMHCAGHEAPLDHQKGLWYFQKYASKNEHTLEIIHAILASFVYWFDIPLPNQFRKKQLSVTELYEVLKRVISKSPEIREALFYLFIYIFRANIFGSVLLYKAFQNRTS